MSEYKPGTRVRVVYEGEVLDSLGGNVFRTDGKPFFLDLTSAVSIEKLDPEPKWVQGAVVRNGRNVYVFDGCDWRGLSSTLHQGIYNGTYNYAVAEAWRQGTLKILWNGDE